MREGLGQAVLVVALWALVLRGGACDPPAPAPDTACRWISDPLVPGGALCARSTRSGTTLDGPTRLALGLPLDPNLASSSDLVAIPGIGERTALSIVVFRTHTGSFRSLDDLALVPGLGPARASALRRYLTIDSSVEVTP